MIYHTQNKTHGDQVSPSKVKYNYISIPMCKKNSLAGKNIKWCESFIDYYHDH